MTTKKTNALFETATCSRCGGSGNYSYCQMHGTTCFGCGGSGHKLTKRGMAAQNWLRKQQTVSVSDLKVGDRVYEEDFFKGVRGWFRVTEVEGDKVTCQYKRKFDTVPNEVSFQGTKEFRVRPGDKVELRWQQMVGLAYQASLTKAGTPRKVR